MRLGVVVTADPRRRASRPIGRIITVEPGPGGGLTVGRDAQNDLVIEDRAVAPRMGRFVDDSGTWRLEKERAAVRYVVGADDEARGDEQQDGAPHRDRPLQPGDRFGFGNGVVISVVDVDAVRYEPCGNGWWIDARLRHLSTAPVFSMTPPLPRHDESSDDARAASVLRKGWLLRTAATGADLAWSVAPNSSPPSSSPQRPRWLPSLLDSWHDDGAWHYVFAVGDVVDGDRFARRAEFVDDAFACRVGLDFSRALHFVHARTGSSSGVHVGIDFDGRVVVVPHPPHGGSGDEPLGREVLRFLQRLRPLRHPDLRALQQRADQRSLGVVELLQRAARDVGVASDDELRPVVRGLFADEHRALQERDEELALLDARPAAARTAVDDVRPRRVS